nr:hypothetical protein [Tanacetum cinerariifolium]
KRYEKLSNQEGLHKRSLPSSWSQVALIMRTKPRLDTLSFDDLYNNLRVFERDVKGTTASSSNTHNVAFVSADNTSSTNDVAMISMRIKKFHKRKGRKLQCDTKDPVGFDKTKVKCFNCHKMEHFARDCRAKGNQDSQRRDDRYNGNKTRDNFRRSAYQDDSKALVTIDGEDINWSGHIEEDAQNYAMMAYSSSNSGSDNEVKSCSKTSKEFYARLKKLYDEQRDKLDHANVEIAAYTLALKRLLNTQMSANDKFGLGYGDYRYGSILSYENEVLQCVFMNKGRNYMPSGPDVQIDCSKFTYGLKQTSVDESDSKPNEYASCESDSSVETTTSMPELVKNAPKVICELKVWSDAPIIEEYESDSDNDSVSNVKEDKEKPSFAFTDFVKHVKTSRENVKETGTPNHNLKIKKQDKNGYTKKGLGYAFTRKACFDDPHRALKDKGIVDSGCSMHMTGNKAHLAYYQEFKNKVLFTDTDCLVLSPEFKLPDENQVLLKIPRQHNMYSINLKNIDPFRDLACLFAKASIDESNKWHRRLGHVNFKNLNKLVKKNLVRVENQANKSAGLKKANNGAGTQANDDQSANSEEIDHHEEHFVLPIWSAYSTTVKSLGDKIEKNTDFKTSESLRKEATHDTQNANTSSTNLLNTVSTPLSTDGPSRAFNDDDLSYLDDPSMPHLEDIYAYPSEGIFTDSSYDDKAVQTRSKVNKNSEAHALEKSGYRIGDIDNTLFIKQDKKDIMLVQVYVDDIIFGSTKKSWCDEFEELMKNRFQMSSMGELTFFLGLQTASTPIETQKPLVKDEEPADVDVHLYRFQVTPKTSHLQAVKRIFRYLKGQPKLGLWYPKVSSFDLEAYSDSDYTGANLDKKSTTRGCQFLGRRLISWKCKKHTFVATSTTEAEYVAAAHCFFHSKTKHIEIRHHFIRDAYEKKLIQVLKIRTDDNGADLLTKAFDVSMFNFLVVNIGLLNLYLHWLREGYLNKELASPKETALGKDNSNPLIVDSLLKNYMVINAPCYSNEALAIPEQTTTGKEISNQFMAGSLPKTTLPTSHGLYKDVDPHEFTHFWTTAKVKTINDEVRIQALTDEKRVNIKQSPIYRTLKLDDAEGISCLANAEIFDGLAKMGYEKLSKKLTFYKAFFSHTMALAIICLATNQKFNFSRYTLLSLVKNIEAGVPFFMFPRFVQLLINHQLGDMSHHMDIYVNPSLTKKVFSNMKRVGAAIPTEPSTSKPHKKHKSKKQQPQAPKVPSPESSPKHMLPSPSHDPLSGGQDSMKLKELMDLCTHLSNKVLELESEVVDIKSSSSSERIEKLEGRVAKLEEENRVLKELYTDTAAPIVAKEKSFKQERIIVLNMKDVDEEEPVEVEEVLEVVKAAKLMTEVVTTAGATTTTEAPKVSVPRRIRGVIIQDPKETTSTVVMHSKVQSKDKGKGILIEEPKPLKGKSQIEQDKAFARQLEAELNADINWNAVMEKAQEVKGMTYSEIRPLFEKHFNYNQAFLKEVNEEVTLLEKEVEVEAHKREGESLEKEVTKKQRMDEKAEDLKSHLQIVTNDDDDVYTKATPLASKIPIVYYKIHFERNKPYFKIIRADGNHMLFLSFSTMLKNFNREDLESLWKLFKERFEKTKPKNYYDDYLLKTLRIMFDQPDVEASVWRDQKGRYGLAKVKSWKLFESVGVHCVTFSTTQMFLLVEKRYPLTHFTLEQMLNNVRLEVEEVSEMSLELLRLVRRHLIEGKHVLDEGLCYFLRSPERASQQNQITSQVRPASIADRTVATNGATQESLDTEPAPATFCPSERECFLFFRKHSWIKKTFCKNKARGKHTLHKVTQYKKGKGNQLEDYGVLNELLRSRSNSRGLHMPLVCPNGVVVTYACKRQLAGQAGASDVDRTSASPLADCILVYGASSAFEVSQASPTQIVTLKGLAANFDESHSRTGHCVLQTGPESDAFQIYSNHCALNDTPTLEGLSHGFILDLLQSAVVWVCDACPTFRSGARAGKLVPVTYDNG